MDQQLNIQIVSTETIKPSFPTPNHLKSVELSLLDQFAPLLHIRILLFFSTTSSTCKTDQKPDYSIEAERSKLLRKSLSQTLTSFYPFAGRIRDNLEIDCNDEGAEFVETRVKCSLSTIVKKPEPELLKQLVPRDRVLSRDTIGAVPLLLVQGNSFECGGMAIGVSLSHKIADAATSGTFLNCWAANMTESQVNSSLIPQFFSPPQFPPHALLSSLPQASTQPSLPEKIAVRRLVFCGPRISALKSKLAGPTVCNPTRVEAVLSLIWKCTMEASRASKSSGSISAHLRQSVLFQAVNVRKRLALPLPDSTSGNFSWSYAVKCTDPVHDSEAQNLVALLRKGIEEFKESCDIRTRWTCLSQYIEEYQKLREDSETDIFLATSWCRFPLYGVDFGWGKPTWVCVPNIRLKNYVVLMDARDEYDNGIEVWLSLGEEEMAFFETNQELLELLLSIQIVQLSCLNPLEIRTI